MARRVVLLTGASGLVGTWLRRTAPAGVEVISWLHRTAIPGSRSVTADLRDAEAVDAVFAGTSVSLVLHAAMAGDAASIVDATRNVTAAASRVGAEVVYISTDAVFSGDGQPVDEDTRPDPVWNYGRWKAEAEQLVLQARAASAVVRLPLVVSLQPEDRAVARIKEGARRQRPTRWFHDEIRQPAMASDIAEAVWQITSLDRDQRSGVWHLPGPERLTRYEIAQRVVSALRLDANSIVSIPTPPDANRPRDLHLLDRRARDQLGWAPGCILA